MAVVALALAGCGDDGGGGGGDDDLAELLQEETGQPEAIAECIAEKLGENDQIDRDALESIIRGEGTTDTDTADAYGDAAIECTQEAAGEVPGVPDLTDELSG